VKGSFTGAVADRRGKFEMAGGGTLFLDEIGDMSLKTQAKVLRALQEQVVEPVGGASSVRVDVRVLAATNRDVKAELAARRFREDLYYRLGVVTVSLPPLRDREEDLLLLARAFLQRYVAQYGRRIAGFSAEGLAAMRAHTWPGNVRELENRIRGAVILTEGKSITGADLELAGQVAAARPVLLRDVREQAEQDHVRKALLRCGWNISQAAVELGVSRPTVHDLIKRYRLSREAT
jgi:two-component system NtrC family response regulator